MKAVLLAFAIFLAGARPEDAFAGEAEWGAHIDGGAAAFRRGDYRGAIPSFEAAVKEAEAFGPADRRLALSLNNLGLVLKELGRYADAGRLLERALNVYGNALGRDHPSFASTLDNLGSLYRVQARYDAAEQAYKRALAIREKALGPEHPDFATTMNNLALVYESQSRYAMAEPLYLRSLSITERSLGPEHPGTIATVNNLAVLYFRQGRLAQAESLFQRVVRSREQLLGPDHPDLGTALGNLAQTYSGRGFLAEAESLLRRSLHIREQALGRDHPDVATALNNLASNYTRRGQYSESESLLRRSLAIREKTQGADHPGIATTLNNLAEVYRWQGRYSDAEPLYRRSLALFEKTYGKNDPGAAHAMGNLAGLYRFQGRYADAEPLFQRALQIQEITLGANHPDVATTLNNLGDLYQAQHRYSGARALYARAVSIIEKSLGADNPALAAPLYHLAILHQIDGDFREAELVYKRALGVQQKAFGSRTLTAGTILDGMAGLYQAQRRYDEAESIYRQSIAIHEAAVGPDHPFLGITLNNLSGLYRAQDRLEEALTPARRAARIVAGRYTAAPSGHSGAFAEQRAQAGGFEQLLSLLVMYREKSSDRDGKLISESFAVAQLARANDTAEQLANMAARYATGSDALAQLARARQDTLAKIAGLEGRILRAISAAAADRDAAREASLMAEEVSAHKAVAAIDAMIEKDFPQYRELTTREPLAVAAAQKFLGDEEALVLLLVRPLEGFAWVVRRDDIAVFRLPITRHEVSDTVKRLRAQLDLGGDDPARIIAKPFDIASAHALYRQVLAPVEEKLAGARHLIFVLDGPLTGLPPGLLVTDPPGRPLTSIDEHAEVAWLAQKYSITVLPAVSSLRALRQFERARAGREPFGGFGDPVLEGGAGAPGKANVAALFSRGAVADVDEVRKLARLPESADELRAIAATLKARPDALVLGQSATERAVKQADLTRFRNLAFATHGLMAGEFKGLAEPALVLTPPAVGSEMDDGLLTASEISQLKLNADWVVLSACNTAGPDGTPGAEGLSGLAKAFFYAGARSLLVSHWAVSSDATVALTTRMFEEAAKGASKADALRRSMLALMADKRRPHFAHPAFWAPFVVVGEGNERWNKR